MVAHGLAAPCTVHVDRCLQGKELLENWHGRRCRHLDTCAELTLPLCIDRCHSSRDQLLLAIDVGGHQHLLPTPARPVRECRDDRRVALVCCLVVLELEELVALLLGGQGSLVQVLLERLGIHCAGLELEKFLHVFHWDARCLLLVPGPPCRVHDVNRTRVLVNDGDDGAPCLVAARHPHRAAAGQQRNVLFAARAQAGRQHHLAGDPRRR
mmetsp:Transcript_10352/g.26789  ORF Transcript_10352/g.26789 Transcript_10352/m.26789 type:complete len:211 (-) Transcript_10352:1387-2019(-)